MGKCINRHDGHIASCLCCVHLSADLGAPGYSEYTPSQSASVRCSEGVFDYDNKSDDIVKGLHDYARHCDKFKGTKKEKQEKRSGFPKLSIASRNNPMRYLRAV